MNPASGASVDLIFMAGSPASACQPWAAGPVIRPTVWTPPSGGSCITGFSRRVGFVGFLGRRLADDGYFIDVRLEGSANDPVDRSPRISVVINRMHHVDRGASLAIGQRVLRADGPAVAGATPALFAEAPFGVVGPGADCVLGWVPADQLHAGTRLSVFEGGAERVREELAVLGPVDRRLDGRVLVLIDPVADHPGEFLERVGGRFGLPSASWDVWMTSASTARGSDACAWGTCLVGTGGVVLCEPVSCQPIDETASPIAVIRRVMFMVDGLALKLGLKHPHQRRGSETHQLARHSLRRTSNSLFRLAVGRSTRRRPCALFRWSPGLIGSGERTVLCSLDCRGTRLQPDANNTQLFRARLLALRAGSVRFEPQLDAMVLRTTFDRPPTHSGRLG